MNPQPAPSAKGRVGGGVGCTAAIGAAVIGAAAIGACACLEVGESTGQLHRPEVDTMGLLGGCRSKQHS